MIVQRRIDYAEIQKLLVKRPKLYFRDSGICHTLLAIETQEALSDFLVF